MNRIREVSEYLKLKAVKSYVGFYGFSACDI